VSLRSLSSIPVRRPMSANATVSRSLNSSSTSAWYLHQLNVTGGCMSQAAQEGVTWRTG
jgi:hypothetical protein